MESQKQNTITSNIESVYQPESKLKNKKSFNYSKLLIPIAIIIGCALIACVVWYSEHAIATDVVKQLTAPDSNPNRQPSRPVSIKDVNTNNEPFIGNLNAPVTIAYWTDYQCPYCKQFELSILPDIKKNYIDSGKVKLVFKDYQFLGPDSQVAGLYARAIWENYPQQYFAWREAMYDSQDKENAGFGDEPSIIALTKTITSINTSQITQLVTKNKDTYQKEIDQDKSEGVSFGVQGTPGFIIGNQLIPGVANYSDMAKLIDAQVK